MFTIITLVESLNLNRQWPSVRLNALAVSGTGQARSLKALSHILTQQVLLHLMTHIFFFFLWLRLSTQYNQAGK